MFVLATHRSVFGGLLARAPVSRTCKLSLPTHVGLNVAERAVVVVDGVTLVTRLSTGRARPRTSAIARCSSIRLAQNSSRLEPTGPTSNKRAPLPR